MEISTEQFQTASDGNVVKIQINGQIFYLLSEKKYEELDDLDYGPMTKEEMDLLASHAADLIQDDLDEPL